MIAVFWIKRRDSRTHVMIKWPKGGSGMFARKISCGIPGRCDGCGRTSNDSMCGITFDNRDVIILCSECASKLADKLCDILGKMCIDPNSKDYKAGYCNGYKKGFDDRR